MCTTNKNRDETKSGRLVGFDLFCFVCLFVCLLVCLFCFVLYVYMYVCVFVCCFVFLLRIYQSYWVKGFKFWRMSTSYGHISVRVLYRSKAYRDTGPSFIKSHPSVPWLPFLLLRAFRRTTPTGIDSCKIDCIQIQNIVSVLVLFHSNVYFSRSHYFLLILFYFSTKIKFNKFNHVQDQG